MLDQQINVLVCLLISSEHLQCRVRMVRSVVNLQIHRILRMLHENVRWIEVRQVHYDYWVLHVFLAFSTFI